MYLKSFSSDEVSICEKDLCLTAKGNQAEVVGAVLTTAFALYALLALLKS